MERLSQKPINLFRKVCQEEGFEDSRRYQNYYRFSISKDPEISFAFSLKIPIYLPVDWEYPIELVAFHLSIYFRPRWLDQSFENTIRSFVHRLKEFIDIIHADYPLNHTFNLIDSKTSLEKIISSFFPSLSQLQSSASSSSFSSSSPSSSDSFGSPSNSSTSTSSSPLSSFPAPSSSDPKLDALSSSNFQDFTDFAVHHFVRQANIGSPPSDAENGDLFSEDLHTAFDHLHPMQFYPNATLPATFSIGIPYLQRNSLLYFSTDSEFQHLISEPGSCTYWHDFSDSHVWGRVGFESHLFRILSEVQRETPDFHIEIPLLLENWIGYAQGLFREFQQFLYESQSLDPQFLVPFSDRTVLLHHRGFDHLYGMFFPQLVLDALHASETSQFVIFSPLWDNLDQAPASFGILASWNQFQEAQFHYYQRNWLKAEDILQRLYLGIGDAEFPQFKLQIFLLLSRIALHLNHHNQAIVFLKKAIDLARLGTVPLEDIVEVHIYLIHAYRSANQPQMCADHEEILEKIWDSLSNSQQKTRLQFHVAQKEIPWLLEAHQYSEIDSLLKALKSKIRYHSKGEIVFNYFSGVVLYQQHSLAKAWQFFEKNFTFENVGPYADLLVQSIIDYVEQHLTQQTGDSSWQYNSFQVLQKALTLLNFIHPQHVILATHAYERLIELAFTLRDDKMAQKYQQQLTKLHQIIEFYTS